MRLGTDNTNCSYAHITQPTGEVFPSEAPFSGCKDNGDRSSGIARTAVSTESHNIFFMSGTGANIFAVAFGSGDEEIWAELPANYNFTVGLEYVSGYGLFLLTTSDLYVVKAADDNNTTRPLHHLKSLKQLNISDFSEDAVVTSNSYNNFLFVVDGPRLVVLDVNSYISPSAREVKMPTLTNVMDLAVYVPDGQNIQSLIALESYKLYSLDHTTGASKFILDIPDGSGFPRINTIFFDTFFFADFDKLYTVSIAQGKVLTNATFDGARLAAYFQFHT